MDFEIQIEKLGTLEGIFGFYKYLVDIYGLKKHALLGSSSANTGVKSYSE